MKSTAAQRESEGSIVVVRPAEQNAKDFLGCHLRKRMSGRILERCGRRRYYLHRWPSRRATKAMRRRVHEPTDRRWLWMKDVRLIIERLTPILRGWGQYFRTGNAAKRFNQLDTYVFLRLRRWMKARKGRHLSAGVLKKWEREFFHNLGLHRLLGTVRYPEAA